VHIEMAEGAIGGLVQVVSDYIQILNYFVIHFRHEVE
jgi:hypothetical protein